MIEKIIIQGNNENRIPNGNEKRGNENKGNQNTSTPMQRPDYVVPGQGGGNSNNNSSGNSQSPK
jgi:hypothetical protein